jgi:hypothetical protein
MSQTPQASQKELSAAEQAKIKKDFDSAKQELSSEIQKQKSHYQSLLSEIDKRRQYAKTELLDCEQEIKRLSGLLGTEETIYHTKNMVHLKAFYASMLKSLDVEAAAQQFNVSVLDDLEAKEGKGSKDLVFRIGSEHVDYKEAMAEMDISLAQLYWNRNIVGIDMVFKLVYGQGEFTSVSDEVEQVKQNRFERLETLKKDNKDFYLYANQLASELRDFQEKLSWAAGRMKTIPSMPEEMKKKALSDVEWNKFSGKVNWMASLKDSANKYPEMGELFPSASKVTLPY